jgi:hypothetical protein
MRKCFWQPWHDHYSWPKGTTEEKSHSPQDRVRRAKGVPAKGMFGIHPNPRGRTILSRQERNADGRFRSLALDLQWPVALLYNVRMNDGKTRPAAFHEDHCPTPDASLVPSASCNS